MCWRGSLEWWTPRAAEDQSLNQPWLSWNKENLSSWGEHLNDVHLEGISSCFLKMNGKTITGQDKILWSLLLSGEHLFSYTLRCNCTFAGKPELVQDKRVAFSITCQYLQRKYASKHTTACLWLFINSSKLRSWYLDFVQIHCILMG